MNYIRLGYYELSIHEILSKNFEYKLQSYLLFTNTTRDWLEKTEEIRILYFNYIERKVFPSSGC